MKLFQGKFIYLLFLYFPLFVGGIALTYFFPEEILTCFRVIAPVFLLLTLILAGMPSAKYRLGNVSTVIQPYDFWLRLAGWCCLELAIILIIFVLFTASVSVETANTKTALLSQTAQLYLLNGLFPWTLYLLLGLAIAYFSSAKTTLPMLRAALRPLNKTNTIFGLGIDFTIKQGIIFIGALTFALCLATIIQLLGTELNIFSPSNKLISSLLGNTLIFILLASAFWRRLTRYLWLKHYPLAVFFIFYVFVVLTALLLSILGVNLLSPFLLACPLKKIVINWPFLHAELNRWLLLKLCWEILIAPLVAILIVKLAQGFTIRTVIFQALVLPFLMALVLGIDHFWLNNVVINQFIQLANQTYVALGAAIISLILIIAFFQLPESLRIVQLTNKTPLLYPNLLAIRTFLLLIAVFLVIYLLTGIPLIILYFSGILIPIFLIIFWACLSLIISIK